METDKMSTASSVGAAERRPLLQALVLERRILFGCTILVGLCSFAWITAVCTEKWVVINTINSPYGVLLSKEYFLWSGAGVWRVCRHLLVPHSISNTTALPQESRNVTGNIITNCTNYLAQPIMKGREFEDKAYDVDTANYVRTMVSFAIISLFVMAMGCGFSIYTFRNPRYMFKRLAAGIHFITTACTFVVVQVMMSSVDNLKKIVKNVYPEKAYHYYHISFFLAWFVVLINVSSAASFLWYSRKRKGDKAATDELAMADEPTIIGR